MSLWANGDRGLKDLGAPKQRTVLFNLAQEFYSAQPSSSSQHFFTYLRYVAIVSRYIYIYIYIYIYELIKRLVFTS